MQREQLTGGQALARQLVAEGVEVVFGLPGDQLMTALDAFSRTPELRYVVTRHEQATTYLADGYARTSGRPGVAMVVPGVGVYNAATGLATAYACSSPVLLLAGQVNRAGIGKDLGLLHDVHDQLEIVRPITKWARRVLEPQDVTGAVREAFARMTTGRPRPVEIEIPPETLAEKALTHVIPPVGAEKTPPPVAEAAALLRAAANPLVVAGGGAVLGDASAALTRVAELLQAPVVTTREGKGAIDDRHALSVGTAWVNPRMRPVLAAADVVLAVGTRGAGLGLRDDQRLLHLDIDAEQIGRHHPATVALAGDAARTLEALAEHLPQRPGRTAEARAMRAAAEKALAAVGPQWEMVRALRAGVPENGILVCDTTSVAYMCHMGYPVYAPRTYLSTSYMGTLGFGYPAGLGAKVAAPDTPVVTVTGDGGFLFASNELATAVQHGIHTVTVVFDDSAYGNSNRDQRDRFGGREYGTVLRNPDWVALARAFGADGMVVDDVAKLPGALTEALATPNSTVIAVPMDRLPSPF
ncbi:thiamine pyrophosphate-binding protein [Cryptosporangium arvum]|uniref:thiamine pyrophosphate-binding protein n=1 Tax=Cryptosporangium arvum TaxID=80871 RepID=UPI0004ADDE07|nr:thiamine pyrophosphate-binding protein [Cryptosporangium arvum]